MKYIMQAKNVSPKKQTKPMPFVKVVYKYGPGIRNDVDYYKNVDEAFRECSNMLQADFVDDIRDNKK